MQAASIALFSAQQQAAWGLMSLQATSDVVLYSASTLLCTGTVLELQACSVDDPTVQCTNSTTAPRHDTARHSTVWHSSTCVAASSHGSYLLSCAAFRCRPAENHSVLQHTVAPDHVLSCFLSLSHTNPHPHNKISSSSSSRPSCSLPRRSQSPGHL